MLTKLIRLSGVAVTVFSLAVTLHGQAIDYKDLHGARRKDPKTGCWEVGWKAANFKQPETWIYPIEGMEGVVFKAFSRAGKGNSVVTPDEMGIDKAKGVELPQLGIKSDLYIMIKRNVECPVRYYSDNGGIAQEWWSLGFYTHVYVGEMVQQLDWLKADGSSEKRQKLVAYQDTLKVHNAPFDSRWLDSDNDGFWKADPLMKFRNYQLALSLEYVMILPATTIDVPMRPEWKTGAKLEFECLGTNGKQNVSILLDPEYMPESGNLRIGFAGNDSDYVYVAQNPGRGKDGIVVGRVMGQNGRLAILPGTLRIEKEEWIPYDRVPVDKRKWIGQEGSPMDDFSAFDERPNRDWGYLISYETRPGTKFGGRAFPLRNECNKIVRDQDTREKADALRIAYKYGQRVALDIGGEMSPANYIPDKYKGEELDPETGKFVKAPFLDWTNPEAVAWEQANVKERVAAYKGVVTYLQVHEGWGSGETANMSMGALEDFRKFVGDPKAKFPVVPTSPNTDRTTNAPTPELIAKYKEWKLGRYRGELVMLAFLRAGYEVFKGDPHFKGAGYFGGVEDGGAYFVPYFAAGKEVAMLCPENVRRGSDPVFQIWLEATRKSNGRIILLPHSYPMLVTDSTERFIEWFEDIGLRPEVGGLLLGGGGLLPKALFDALAAKHFGRGRMSVEEAEKRIQTTREKGLFCLDNFSEKQLKVENARSQGKFQMDTAQRVKAPARTVNVDGDLNKWSAEGWTRVRKEGNLLLKKEWDSQDDLSFSFAFAYDNDNLYLAVQVRDDTLVLPEQVLSATGDEVNLFLGFIADPLKDRVEMGKNAFQMRLIPDAKYKEVYLGQRFLTPLPGSRVVCRRTEHGYDIEAAIPWAYARFVPKKGSLLPLEFYVIDADDAGGDPSAGMLWNMCKGKKSPWQTAAWYHWGLLELE